MIVVIGGCGQVSKPPGPAAFYSACRQSDTAVACMRFLDKAIHVTSIRLTSVVPTPVKSTCAAAARMTQIRVLCPHLVPVGAIDNPDIYGLQGANRGSYSASINNGENAGYIHWEFGAIRGPEKRLWVFDRPSWAAASPKTPPARIIGARHYFGYAIRLYRFPDDDGQLQGHDAAFATSHGISYFVSLHGRTHDDADIAMLLAILARTA
jgi:hypothetical protein